MRWYSTGFVCPLLRSVYHRLLPISVLQQLDQIAPCAVVIDVGASAARHHPCRHAVYVCRARLQWIYARRMRLLRFTAAACADQRLPSGVSARRMKRCDTLRDVLSGAGGQGKGETGERGHGAEHRSAVVRSSASMLKRAPLGVRTLRSNGLWSEVVPPTKSIELRRAVAPPCVTPSACALHQHNRTISHHVQRAQSQLHAHTHAPAALSIRMQPGYIAGTRGTD